jgi:hypothetical protein
MGDVGPTGINGATDSVVYMGTGSAPIVFNGSESSSTFTPPLAKYLWINGIQADSSYRFTSLYVSGSEPVWTLNTSCSSIAPGTVIFHYAYILPSIVTSGGTITYTSGRIFHTFTGNGTFTIERGSAAVEIMAIGGGGGGGCYSGGGGGAGNMIVATGTLGVGAYTVGVGDGGAGGVFGTSPSTSGGSSTFDSNLTALGGGGGGSYGIAAAQDGGCGGGATSGDTTGVYNVAGTGITGTVSSPLTVTSNLATNGGAGWDDFGVGGAGGGGTSAAGVSQTSAVSSGQDGGAGTLYRGTYYGGGGGGARATDDYYGAPYTGGAGGTGGGGNGSSGDVTLVPGTDGAPNTGGGGGGATGLVVEDQVGLSGGSGIVIVSYVYTG